MENFALKQLAQIVYHYCGLNYIHNIASLEIKVSRRLKELSFSLWEYIRYLEANVTEWDTLVEILTINETYFFREDKQLSHFRDYLLPLLKKKKEGEQIKIWSAACSSGEEPYSLAMLILDSGIIKPHEVQIIGSDINKKVLNTAEKGVYYKKSLSFRRIPQEWLPTYFEEDGNDYKIKQHVKDMVSFQYLNLLEEKSMKAQSGFDIIFCRNVLIYFDSETVRKVTSSFYDSLNDDGCLFLGHAENISNMGIGFETVNAEGTFYYRKGINNGENLRSISR